MSAYNSSTVSNFSDLICASSMTILTDFLDLFIVLMCLNCFKTVNVQIYTYFLFFLVQ